MHRWLRHRLPTTLAEPAAALWHAAPLAGVSLIWRLPQAVSRCLAL